MIFSLKSIFPPILVLTLPFCFLWWSSTDFNGEPFLTPHSGIASCLDLPSPDLSRKSYTFNLEPVALLPKRIGIRGGFVPDKAAPQP